MSSSISSSTSPQTTPSLIDSVADAFGNLGHAGDCTHAKKGEEKEKLNETSVTTFKNGAGEIVNSAIERELPFRELEDSPNLTKICRLIHSNFSPFLKLIPYVPVPNHSIASFLFHVLLCFGKKEKEVQELIKLYKNESKRKEFCAEFEQELYQLLLKNGKFDKKSKTDAEHAKAALNAAQGCANLMKTFAPYLNGSYERVLIVVASEKEGYQTLIGMLAERDELSNPAAGRKVLDVFQDYYFYHLSLSEMPLKTKVEIMKLLTDYTAVGVSSKILELVSQFPSNQQEIVKTAINFENSANQLNLKGCSLASFPRMVSQKPPLPKITLLTNGGFETWKGFLEVVAHEMDQAAAEIDETNQETLGSLPSRRRGSVTHLQSKRLQRNSQVYANAQDVKSKIKGFHAVKNKFLEKMQEAKKEGTVFQFQFEESAFLLDYLDQYITSLKKLFPSELSKISKAVDMNDPSSIAEEALINKRICRVDCFIFFTEFFYSGPRLSSVERMQVKQRKALELAEYEEMQQAAKKKKRKSQECDEKKAAVTVSKGNLDHVESLAASRPADYLEEALHSGAQKIASGEFINALSPFLLLKREVLEVPGSARSKELHDHFFIAAQHFEMWVSTIKLRRADLSKACLHQFLFHLSVALEQHIKRKDDPSIVTMHHSLIRLAQEAGEPAHELYSTLDECHKEMRYPSEYRGETLSQACQWLDQFEALAKKPTLLKKVQGKEIGEICDCFEKACTLLGYQDKNFLDMLGDIKKYLTQMKWEHPEQCPPVKISSFRKLETALKSQAELLKQNNESCDPTNALKDALYFMEFVEKGSELEMLFPHASLKFCHLSNRFQAEKAVTSFLRASAMRHGSGLVLGHHYKHFTSYLEGMIDEADLETLNRSYLGLKHHYWHILEEGHDAVSYHTSLDASLGVAKSFQVIESRKNSNIEIEKDPNPAYAILNKLINEKLKELLNLDQPKTVHKKV